MGAGSTKFSLLLLLAALLCVREAAGAELDFKYYGEFGRTGRGRNELERPVGIATSDKFTAVVDQARNTVVLYDRDGTWLKSLGRPKGAGPAAFDAPSSVAIDTAGRIWVADTGNDRVLALNQNGNVLVTIGTLGTRKGEFKKPVDVALGGRTRVFVADRGNARVQLFNDQGAFQDLWRDPISTGTGPVKSPVALAYSNDGHGHFWVANEGSAIVRKLDLDGRVVKEVDLGKLVEGNVSVADMQCDAAFDRIFLADSASNRVLVLNSGGEMLSVIPLPEDVKIGSIAVSWSLDILVTDLHGRRVLVYKRE